MKTLELKKLTTLPYGPEEAINRLRVNVNFCGDRFKKILITSSVPNEGKSFISMNLWRQLAETGKKVVLVDADIRKSVLRTRHQITSGGAKLVCLEDYLSGQAELEDVVYQTNIENAHMVPTAYTVSNPALLIQSQRFSDMLNQLAAEYDYVLIDTPPLTAVADGDMVASQCDGAILVVRSASTSRRLISTSMKQLENANCELMGVVLNRVQIDKNPYYYRQYKHGYGYGYGYGYGTYGRDDSNEKK